MHLKESLFKALQTNPELSILNYYVIKNPNHRHQTHLQIQTQLPYSDTIKTIDLINADDQYQIGINLNQFMNMPKIDLNDVKWRRFVEFATYHRWKLKTEANQTKWLMVRRRYDQLQFELDLKLAYQLLNTVNGMLDFMISA